ncbi:MAG: DUF167 domain-containing protein [Pyrinomonas sp.]|uniref:DUF167 domain-containing protein n=1 Tax=Pyrinomonas sp. TaxID=2080306 RepID=UPI0033260C5C
MIAWTEKEDAVWFNVRAVPRASRSKIVGEWNGALRVQLAAPPAGGAANEELVRTLAEALRVAPHAVEIVRGAAGQNKRVRVRGLNGAELERRLAIERKTANDNRHR